MAVSDNYTPTKTIGNGSTVAFTASWNVIAASNMRVYLENVATGVQVLQVKDTDYSLSFNESGLTVDFSISSAPPATEYVVLARSIAQDQIVPFKTSQGFQGAVTENSFDKVISITQDIQDQIDRSLKFPIASGKVGTLPSPVDGYGLIWDGTDGDVRNTTSSLSDLEGAAEIVSANIANVNTVAGISSNITTVSGMTSDISTVVDNIVDIQNAEENALAAAASATSASNSANLFESFFTNVYDYGNPGTGTGDDAVIINAAIQATSVGGIVYLPIPSVYYNIQTNITLKAGVTLLGNGLGGARLHKDGTASDEYIIKAPGTGTFSDCIIEKLTFTTGRSSASGTQALINFDGANYSNIKIRGCIFTNTTAYANCVFFKCASGKTIDNIELSGNLINSTHRMGFEIINHDNTSNYNITGVKIVDNTFASADYMGVSVSGPISGIIISRNRFKNCGTNGIEIVGPRGCLISKNTFEGTMTQLISSGEGSSLSVGSGIVIANNTCAGLVTGRIELINAGGVLVMGNQFNMSGIFSLHDSNTGYALVTSNRFITTGSNVIICDSSNNNTISNNYIDNTASGSVTACVRAYGAATTVTIIKNNDIRKGTGGVHIDAASSATTPRTEGNRHSGVYQSNVLPYSTSKWNATVATGASTTSTCTITFEASSSWRPNVVKCAASCVDTSGTGGTQGAAESHTHVKTNSGATTASIANTDITTSANLVLSRAFGTNTMTITATVTAGVQVFWDVEVCAHIGAATVAFA